MVGTSRRAYVETVESTAPQTPTAEYEAPRLVTLGSVSELTEGCHGNNGKHLGQIDHFKTLHLTNCSS